MSRLSLLVAPAAILALAASASAQRYAPVLVLDSTFSAAASLMTDVENADVEVVTGASGRIRVRIYSTGRDEGEARDFYQRQHFNVALRRGGVAITDDPERTHSWNRRRGPDLRIEITVPSRVDLDVATSDGDIQIGDVTGRIAVRSSDGDLRLGRLSGSDIEAETSDGDIEAKSLDAPRVRVRTSDGDVTLHGVSGGLRAETSDGDVEVTLVKSADVRITSNDGDVTVRVPRGVGFDVDLSGGDIDVDDLQIQVSGRVNEGHLRGKIGAGGHRLIVRTSDGDVALRGA